MNRKMSIALILIATFMSVLLVILVGLKPVIEPSIEPAREIHLKDEKGSDAYKKVFYFKSLGDSVVLQYSFTPEKVISEEIKWRLVDGEGKEVTNLEISQDKHTKALVVTIKKEFVGRLFLYIDTENQIAHTECSFRFEP